jgi:hypothetical protein
MSSPRDVPILLLDVTGVLNAARHNLPAGGGGACSTGSCVMESDRDRPAADLHESGRGRSSGSPPIRTCWWSRVAVSEGGRALLTGAGPPTNHSGA